MSFARNVVTTALMQRSEAGIKVRQPLKSFQLPASSFQTLKKDLLEIVKDEVNVKEIVSGDDFKLDVTLTDELKEEGIVREIIRAVQEYRKEQQLKPGEQTIYHFSGSQEEQAVALKYLNHIQKTTSTTIEFPGS